MTLEDGEAIRLAPRWAALCRSGDRLLLSTEERAVCEADPVRADILVALTQTRTVSELEQSLAGRRSRAEILAALGDLGAGGFLHYGRQTADAESAYWDSIGCAPPSASIGFEALCEPGRGAVEAALGLNGLKLAAHSEFLVVTTDDYLRPELIPISQRNEPWLLAKPVGHTVWVGPIFIPGQTPCWSCMALWMKPHRWEQISFYGGGEEDLPPQPSFAAVPTSIGLAAHLIGAAAAVWVAQGSHPELEGAILSLDTRTLRLHRSIVRRHPECKQCRPCSGIAGKSKTLHSFVSPVTGVLSAVRVTDEPVCGFYHALGYFAAPLPKPGVGRLLRTQHSVGKGLTSHEAETCSIAEGLERYSVLFRGDEPRVRARIDQVEGIHPEDVLLFSESQYQNREHWNNTHSEIQWVPERFDPEAEIEWTEVHSLVTGRTRFVPAALCFMHYDFRGERQICAADSNGCAAARTFTDARLAALLELIERDAVAIWWYNRLNLPALDLGALGDAKILQAEEGFRAGGRALHVLDISTDLGVPACVAIAPKLDGSAPCFGAAAELSYERAAFKAISEAAQVCFWAQTGNGSEELLSWVRTTSVHNNPYLRAHGSKVAPCARAMHPGAALEQTVDRLYAAGLESFCLDLTRAEIGLPVARVFVPGLRHFWARLGPGRLYDVPVRQSLLESAHSEADLNPVPCMI